MDDEAEATTTHMPYWIHTDPLMSGLTLLRDMSAAPDRATFAFWIVFRFVSMC